MEIGMNPMMVLRLETTGQTYIQSLERILQICLEYLSQKMRMEQAEIFTRGAKSRMIRTGSRSGGSV
eukprot:1367326-Pyramimonas_sp.AAC.1